MGSSHSTFVDFRTQAKNLDESDLQRIYSGISSLDALQGETDLTEDCTERLLESVVGASVLEVGCGRGYLLKLLKLQGFSVTGVDFAIQDSDFDPSIQLVEASANSLPFPDMAFDTVISTHTLEHIPDIDRALAELRRCASQRLILVLPKERPYAWGFNLHVHFFPYEYSVRNLVGIQPQSNIIDLGDWVYIEDKK